MVVFLDNGHRDSANTHDIVKTQSDRLRAITGVCEELKLAPVGRAWDRV